MSKRETYTSSSGLALERCQGCRGLFIEDGIVRGKCIVCRRGEKALKPKPQPKKKNAYSGGEKGLTFHGKEIHSVFIGNTSSNKLGVMVTLSDGTSVNFFGVDRQRLSRSGGLGQPISAQSLLNLLIAKYVK